MVAAQSADRAPDVSIASELGSLLHVHRSIRHPYWRLQALVRLAPLYDQFGLARDRLDREMRELAARVGTGTRVVATPRQTPSERFIALVDAIWEEGSCVTARRRRGGARRADEASSPDWRGAPRAARAPVQVDRRSAPPRAVDRPAGEALGRTARDRARGPRARTTRGCALDRQLDSCTDHAAAAWLSIAAVLVERTDTRSAMSALSRIALPGLQPSVLAVPGAQTSPAVDQRVLVVHHPRDDASRGCRSRVDARRPSEALRRDSQGAPRGRRLPVAGHRIPQRRVATEREGEDGRAVVKTDSDRRELVGLLAIGGDPDVRSRRSTEEESLRSPRHYFPSTSATASRPSVTRLYPRHWSPASSGSATPSSDPRSIERALYDEGVALSARAAVRRRVC